MNGLDYCILVGLITAGLFAVAWIVRKKKKGKGGCGYCPYQGNCTDKSCR